MPRPKVFTIGLAAADREFLSKLTVTGMHPARMIIRARVLLELDENAGPVADRAVIADRVGTSENTVRAVAKRFDETSGDVLATIGRKPRQTPPLAPIVTGDVEARSPSSSRQNGSTRNNAPGANPPAPTRRGSTTAVSLSRYGGRCSAIRRSVFGNQIVRSRLGSAARGLRQ
jgi:hypothetical protein